MFPAVIASLGFAVFVFRAFWRDGCYRRFLRRVPVRSRRRSVRLRISRRVVNSVCRLAKPVSPSPEALHNRATHQSFLFAVLATPSFTETVLSSSRATLFSSPRQVTIHVQRRQKRGEQDVGVEDEAHQDRLARSR